MIDRSYLPYRSARRYVDRGMAKWAGFFISDHQAALKKSQHSYPTTSILDQEEDHLILTQAYLNQADIIFFCHDGTSIQGSLVEIQEHRLLIRHKRQILALEGKEIAGYKIRKEDHDPNHQP